MLNFHSQLSLLRSLKLDFSNFRKFVMNKFFEFNLNLELGEIFNECTAYQISIEYLNKALDISNSLPINKYRLVKAYKLRGKSKMFLNDGQQKINELDWDLYWKAKKLNYWEAILDFSKAIEIDPKDSFLYFWRGFAYEFLEEYPTAVKDLKISKQLDPGFTLTTNILDHIESKGFQ